MCQSRSQAPPGNKTLKTLTAYDMSKHPNTKAKQPAFQLFLFSIMSGTEITDGQEQVMVLPW